MPAAHSIHIFFFLEFDIEKPFLEASLRRKPGEFACSPVLAVPFTLHPRLKTPGIKTGAHRAVTVLQGVLSAFSVTNRRNMFVYQDRNDHVYYLRLHECPPTKDDKFAVQIDDLVDLGRARSFSYGSAFPRRFTDQDASYEVLEPGNVETETVSIASQWSAGGALEDYLYLVVHGVTEAGPSITVELVDMLKKRLDEAVLDVISVMLLRNPQCKLRPEDVRFIQPAHEPPVAVLKVCFSISKA